MAFIFDFFNEDQQRAFQVFSKLMQRETIPTPQEKKLLGNFLKDCLEDPDLKIQLQKAMEHVDPNNSAAQNLILLLDMMHWARYYQNYETAQMQLNDQTLPVTEKLAAVGLLRDLSRLKPFLSKLERLGVLSHQTDLEKLYQTVNQSQKTLLTIDIQAKLTKSFFLKDHFQLETARGQTLNYFKQLLHVLTHAPLQKPAPK